MTSALHPAATEHRDAFQRIAKQARDPSQCVANPGVEFLICHPKASKYSSVELKAGSYQFEWFNQGTIAKTGSVESSGKAQEFKPPFDGDAVVYLKAQTNCQEN